MPGDVAAHCQWNAAAIRYRPGAWPTRGGGRARARRARATEPTATRAAMNVSPLASCGRACLGGNVGECTYACRSSWLPAHAEHNVVQGRMTTQPCTRVDVVVMAVAMVDMLVVAATEIVSTRLVLHSVTSAQSSWAKGARSLRGRVSRKWKHAASILRQVQLEHGGGGGGGGDGRLAPKRRHPVR
eukprot:143352-Chlamydomonas_euryale.AAC.2